MYDEFISSRDFIICIVLLLFYHEYVHTGLLTDYLQMYKQSDSEIVNKLLCEDYLLANRLGWVMT